MLSREIVSEWLHLPPEVTLVHDVIVLLESGKFPDVGEDVDFNSLPVDYMTCTQDRVRVTQIGDVKFE